MTLGAQPGTAPVVPCAQAMTGMPPLALAVGTTTSALATAGSPSSRVVVFRIRHAEAPSGILRVYGSARTSFPGSAGTEAGAV